MSDAAAGDDDAPARAQRSSRWLAWLAPLADVVTTVALLRGKARHGGHDATMLIAGSRRRVRWLVDRYFDGAPRREPLGHVPIWRLARTLRKLRARADLTIVRVARVSASRLDFGDDYLPVPDWMGMRIDAPFDLNVIAKLNWSVADDIRRVRNGDWVVEISHRAADLAAFDRDMYRPYVRNRFRADAHLRSKRALKHAFRRGGILWVRHGGARVAGVVFEHRRNVLDVVALGVAEGDVKWLKAGALAAVYAHLIDYARIAGCASIDLRGSRPSLADGLTRYKRKWGAVVYDRPDVLSSTLVHWSRFAPPLGDFLADVPLVFRDREGLSAVAVAAPGEPASGDATFKRLGVPGLERLIVLTASTAGATAPGGACTPIAIEAVATGPRALVAAAASTPDDTA